MRTGADYLVLCLKGLLMGAADIIPGVSGGTVAFISGIYEELITSIKNVNIGKLFLLKKQGFSAFWSAINGNFLLCLLIGIGISMLSLSHLVSWLLISYSEFLWSFFFGLIVASTYFISKNMTNWSPGLVLAFLIACLASYIVTLAPTGSGSDHLLAVFFSGSIAICAMILPGISGSFILLLMGMYAPMMEGGYNDKWKIALKTSSEAVRDLVFKNMSTRAADMLKEDMDAMPAVKLSDVESVQFEILQITRKLEEEGKVIIASGDSTYV